MVLVGWFSVYFTRMWKVFKMHFCLQSTRGSYTYDLVVIKLPLSQFTAPEPRETNTGAILRKVRQGDLHCETLSQTQVVYGKDIV